MTWQRGTFLFPTEPCSIGIIKNFIGRFNVAGEWTSFLYPTWDGPVSNLEPKTSYPNWRLQWFSLVPRGKRQYISSKIVTNPLDFISNAFHLAQCGVEQIHLINTVIKLLASQARTLSPKLDKWLDGMDNWFNRQWVVLAWGVLVYFALLEANGLFNHSNTGVTSSDHGRDRFYCRVHSPSPTHQNVLRSVHASKWNVISVDFFPLNESCTVV
jgi:hypothetical protein